MTAPTSVNGRERPIIFSGPMVRAILEGRKTQTRRVMQLQPSIKPTVYLGDDEAAAFAGPSWKGQALAVWPGESEFDYCDCHCPQGTPGDTLWVRETWADVNSESGPAILYRADGCAHLCIDDAYPVEYERYPNCQFTMWHSNLLRGEPDHSWRRSIHMPRWACRLFLRVTAVRVERLNEITENDAQAEGAFFTDYGRKCGHGGGGWREVGDCPAPEHTHPQNPGWSVIPTSGHDECLHTARSAFFNLWEKLNSKRGYGYMANPWVWVIEFERISP